MKKHIMTLCAIASLATASAQQNDYFAKLELRGINNLLTQAGAVAQLMGQDMTPDMLKGMMGGIFSSPNMDGIDLDGTVHLFVPEIDPEADAPPAVVAAIPTLGKAFQKQLMLSMDEKAGDAPDEMMFMPKGGGGLGGMPSLATMPFASKSLDTHMLVGMDMDSVRKAAADFAALSAKTQVPGLLTIDLNVDQTRTLMKKGMEVQAEQSKAMQKMMLDSQRDIAKQLKEAGEDPSDIEDLIKDLEATDSAGPDPEKMMEGLDSLMAQMDGLRFGLDAKNRYFSLYTIAGSKAGTAMAQSVAKMQPPKAEFLRALPSDAIMSYVGNWPDAGKFVEGYMGWVKEMAGEEAGMEGMMALIEESQAIMKDQLLGDIAMAWLPGTEEQPINIAGATAVRDPAKYIADSEKMYEKMGDIDIGNEIAGEMKMEMTPAGERSYKGLTIKKYSAKMDAKPVGPGPNPADMFKNMEAQVGHNADTVFMAYSEKGMNSIIDRMSDTAATSYEKSGLFARNFPSLKQTPSSMYTLDLLGYINFAMAMSAPEMAANVPKTGGVLTGWSNKLGNSYIHVDRISFADVNQVVQAGMMAYQAFMQQMQQGFEQGFEDDGF